eukprot:3934084-Rhodomonas_salina.5
MTCHGTRPGGPCSQIARRCAFRIKQLKLVTVRLKKGEGLRKGSKPSEVLLLTQLEDQEGQDWRGDRVMQSMVRSIASAMV